MAMIEEHKFMPSYYPLSHTYPPSMSNTTNDTNLTLHCDPMLSDTRFDGSASLFSPFSQMQMGLGMGMGIFEGNALGLKSGYDQQQQHQQPQQGLRDGEGKDVMFGTDTFGDAEIGMGMGIGMMMNDDFTTTTTTNNVDSTFNEIILHQNTDTKPQKPTTTTPPLIPYNTPPLSTYDGSPSIPASSVNGDGDGSYSPEMILTDSQVDDPYYYDHDQYELDNGHGNGHYRQSTYPGTNPNPQYPSFLPSYLYDDYHHESQHHHHQDYYADGFSEREEPSLPTTPRISVSSMNGVGNGGTGNGMMSKSRSCPSLFDSSSTSFDPRLFSQPNNPNPNPTYEPEAQDDTQPQKLTPQGPRIYRCRQSPTCTKAYGTGAGLRYHLRHFHKLTVIPRQPPVRIARIKPDFYECLRCGKRYGTAAGLRYHKKTFVHAF